MEDLNVLEPVHSFWQVTVAVDTEVEGSKGETKIKTIKEVSLVDGVNPTDVEKKVAEAMKGTMQEWRILSMSESKIQYVY